MSTLTAKYPKFVANQILTNSQLNQLQDRLDLEERNTRLRLIGTGKVCGLDWTISNDNSWIELSKGYGVTSEGYLLSVPETTRLEYFRPYVDPGEKIHGEPYVLWADQEQREVFELFDQESKDLLETKRTLSDSPIVEPQPLSELEPLRTYVLVLYLEQEREQLNSCIVTTCDNKGENICLNVRILLVAKNFEHLIKTMDEIVPIKVPRVHTSKALANIRTGNDLSNIFGVLTQTLVKELKLRMMNVFRTYWSVLGLENTTGALMPALNEIRDPSGSQGFYDVARTYVYAYQELIENLLCFHKQYGLNLDHFREDCCPTEKFPRHLMLGALDGDPWFCHEFITASVDSKKIEWIKVIRNLFLRIRRMAENQNLVETRKGIRITPSHTAIYPLSKRAIPYSYFLTPDLEGLWNPKRCGPSEEVWSYHKQPSQDPLSHDLSSDYEQCTFLRIEGHDLLPCIQAKKEIEQLQEHHNVEFDLVVLYLHDQSEKENPPLGELPDFQMEMGRLLAFDWKPAFFSKFIPKKQADEEKIFELFELYRNRRETVKEHYQLWISVQDKRPLICDTSAFQATYGSQREELLCALSQLIGLLPAKKVDLSKKPGQEFKQNDQLGHLQARLFASATWLRELVDQVFHTGLPNALRHFHYELFLVQYKSILSEVIELTLVVNRLIDMRSQSGNLNFLPEITAYLGRVRVDHLFGLQKVLRDCVHRGLATVFYQYQAVRRRDIHFFQNFVKRIDGLEHRAGVEKGGTFVLLCDQVGEEEQVIADFSLSGKVPCCCHPDIENLCRPPVALPVYRRVFIRRDDSGEKYREVSVEFDVIRNDYDPYLSQQLGNRDKEELDQVVGPQEETTAFGGKITLLDDKQFKYVHSNPLPGFVDRFRYQLSRESVNNCPPGHDIGEVLLLFVDAHEWNPETETGSIFGTVWLDKEKTNRAENSSVRMLGTEWEPHISSNGNYQFITIPPGEYKLQARVESENVSWVEQVTLDSGDEKRVDLFLTGRFMGKVSDESGKGISTAQVNVKERQKGFKTKLNGSYQSIDLPFDEYNVSVSAQGFNTHDDKVLVSSGLESRYDFTLKRISIIVAATNNFFEIVAERTNLNKEQAKKKAKDLYGKRYDERVEELTAASSNSDLEASAPYVHAKEFLNQVITDPERKDKQVIEFYQEVSHELLQGIKEGDAQQQSTYQKVLSTISLAYLDRLTLTNPDKLTVQSRKAVKDLKPILQQAGIQSAGLKNSWNGSKLNADLKIKVTPIIDGLL